MAVLITAGTQKQATYHTIVIQGDREGTIKVVSDSNCLVLYREQIDAQKIVYESGYRGAEACVVEVDKSRAADLARWSSLKAGVYSIAGREMASEDELFETLIDLYK